MDIGIPQRIVTPRGTLTFNQDFYVAKTGQAAQLLLQKIDGMDGSGIRNPTTLKPHKSGAIIHAFKRAPRIWTLEGKLIAPDKATRWVVADMIRGYTDSMVETDAVYYFSPPVNGYEERHLTGRLYEEVDTSQLNDGIAGPKTFNITMIAGDWRAYSAGAATMTLPTYTASPTTHFIPNNGNTDAWLKFTINCNGGKIHNFILRNADSDEAIYWENPGGGTNWLAEDPLSTRHGIVDMFEESITISGGHDGLYGLVVNISDFWKVPPGGANIVFDTNTTGGTGHGATCIVDPLDAWV